MPAGRGTSAPTVDGRTRRAQRTRAGVVEAVLALIADGTLRPTAPQIAERAGVSLRSVFQHFADLNGLFAEAAGRHVDGVFGTVRPIDPSQPLDARLDAFVSQRSRVLEAVTPARRAALLLEPTSPAVIAIRDRLLGLARDEVADTFRPELRARRELADRNELLEALDAAAGWQTWEALRSHQGLSPARARRVVRRMLRSLLAA